ncbi:MAG: UDP-3-O-(3-hydroxymyristoyl)glucosamine N-acyltransferase, partial [Gemmatimonadaceae bacterium]
LDRAGPRHVSFVASAKYANSLARSGAGVVLVADGLSELESGAAARVVVPRPHDAVLALLPHLYACEVPAPWVAPTARIGRGVVLGERVRIEDYVVIGDNVTVGEGTRLSPHVTLYSGTHVGARCVIHSGVRIGSDGFGYVFRRGTHEKIPHIGRCVIGDDVEIGANSTIDRGSIDDTVIGAGTKIDNLVHIAHNVRIGRACLIMAQVGIAGSTRVGDGAIIAGQAGIAGHVTIGDGARVGAQAGVFGSVPAGESWSGYPARPHAESLRASAALFKLSGMMRRLMRLVDEKGSG